jgi:hypothetical protein
MHWYIVFILLVLATRSRRLLAGKSRKLLAGKSPCGISMENRGIVSGWCSERLSGQESTSHRTSPQCTYGNNNRGSLF